MAGAPWYEFEHERNFYEAIFVVLLVCLALVFEVVSHRLQHGVEHSYSYGASRDRHQEEEDRKVPHKQLYKELTERVQGEFMTLGFLACLIFFGNSYGFFDALAEHLTPEAARRLAASASEGSAHGSASSGSAASGHSSGHTFVKGPFDLAMPHNGGQWLHLAEEVHIRLFFGMLIYQVVIFAIVRAGVHQVQMWSEVTNRKMQCQKGFELVNDSQLRDYVELQQFFVSQLTRWRSSQRSRWEQLERQIWLEDPEPEPEEGYSMAATLGKLEEVLSLSHYLSYCIEEGIVDLIEVHHLTWAVLLALFLLCLPLHALLLVTMDMVAGIMLPVCILGLFLVGWQMNMGNQHKLEDLESGRNSSKSEGEAVARVASSAWNGQPILGQAIFLRIVEVLLFLWSYSFSSILLDQHGWRAFPLRTVVELLIYVFCTGVALMFLPRLLVHLLTQTSMPRYLSQRHFESLCRVLREADPAICDMLRCGQISIADLPQGSPTRAHVSPKKIRTRLAVPIAPGSTKESASVAGRDSLALPVNIERTPCHDTMVGALESTLCSAEGRALLTRLMKELANVKGSEQLGAHTPTSLAEAV
jgi:hypothetical protein